MVGILNSARGSGPASPAGTKHVASVGNLGRLVWYRLGGLAVLLLVSSGLVLGYLSIAFPVAEWGQLEARHFGQIGLAVITNLVCVGVAYRTRGVIEARLTTALVSTGLIHAVVIFTIFAFRFYYSRPIMILSVFASISLAAVTTLLVERLKPRRIGVIRQELNESFAAWLDTDAEFIDLQTSTVNDYDLILVNLSLPLDQHWVNFISEAILSGRNVRHIPEYVEQRRGRVSLDHFKPHHANSVWLNPYTRIFKRLLDLTLVIIALPIVIPLVAIASIGIVWKMGLPLFFIQERVGLCGRKFNIYKLRTMRPSKTSSTVATGKSDDRITPFGQFLRRYRIDELPQLLNVIKGEMSLVGPRPEQPSLTRRYLETVPMFRYRNMLPPGITGWAQIKAGYASNDEESQEKLLYDLYYIKNASLLLDLWIILNTVRAVLKGNNAR